MPPKLQKYSSKELEKLTPQLSENATTIYTSSHEAYKEGNMSLEVLLTRGYQIMGSLLKQILSTAKQIYPDYYSK